MIQPHNEHCVRLPEPIAKLPGWDTKIAARQLRILAPRVAPFLSLGRFHDLLPPMLGHYLVVDLCDLERMERLYRETTIVIPTEDQRQRLGFLL